MNASRNEGVEAPEIGFGYERGEEVVVRLETAVAVQVPAGRRTSPSLPAWTIGTVRARRAGDRRWYLVAFRHQSARWHCWVDEASIEGTA